MGSNPLDDLTNVKEKVEYILHHFPESRDSDKVLFFTYMNLFHNMERVLGADAYSKLERFLFSKEVPAYTSLVRVRTHIQNYEGKYVTENSLRRAGRSEEIREGIHEALQ